jgi:hypothetical protein
MKMKTLALSLLTLSLTLVSLTSHGQGIPLSPQEIRIQLAQQVSALKAFQTELKNVQLARRGWITVTLATGLISVVSSLPDVTANFPGLEGSLIKHPFALHIGTDENITIPIFFLGSAVSVGTGYGTYRTFEKIRLRSTDIAKLTDKIDSKLADLEIAATLLDEVEL